MLPFSILGWSVWHQDLDRSPFSPRPVPSQPDPLPGSGEGTPILALPGARTGS